MSLSGATDLVSRSPLVKKNNAAENPVLGPITNHIRYPFGVLCVLSEIKMNGEGRVRLRIRPVIRPWDVSAGWLPRLAIVVLFQVTQLVKQHSELVYSNRNHFNQAPLKGSGVDRLCTVRAQELGGDRGTCQ
jgi:hypothetical protein